MNEIQHKREIEMHLEYKKVHNNKVLDRDAKGLKHDSKGLKDGHDFKTSKKSSNHENPKNQGSDK